MFLDDNENIKIKHDQHLDATAASLRIFYFFGHSNVTFSVTTKTMSYLCRLFKELHSNLVNSRSKPDIRSYNALVKGLCRKGLRPKLLRCLMRLRTRVSEA